jgi:hypothetical protein
MEIEAEYGGSERWGRSGGSWKDGKPIKNNGGN